MKTKEEIQEANRREGEIKLGSRGQQELAQIHLIFCLSKVGAIRSGQILYLLLLLLLRWQLF